MNKIRKSQVKGKVKEKWWFQNETLKNKIRSWIQNTLEDWELALFLRFVQSIEGHKISSILQGMVAKGRCILKRSSGDCGPHPMMDWFLEGKQTYFVRRKEA